MYNFDNLDDTERLKLWEIDEISVFDLYWSECYE